MAGRRARLEGEARAADTGQFQTDGAEHAERFLAALAAFQDRFPDEWSAIRLCPTQHGVEAIADKLKG